MYTPTNIYSGWENDIISDRLSCTLIYLGPRGTQHVETTVPPESIVQSSTTIRENICSSRFEIGQAISRQLDLKLIGQGWPLSYSEVTLSQIFTLPDREVTFPLGTYIVYAPSVRKNSTHTILTAYDYLLKADKVITATNADKFTGSNLWDVFRFAADLCGITLGFSQSDISGYANYAELPNWDGTSLSGYDLSKAVAMGATCRDLLASAAALIGCSLKIDRVTNRLMLVRFIPTEPVYTIDKYTAIDRDINEQYAVANLVSFGKFSGVRFGSLPPGAVVDEADLSLGTNVLLPDNYAPRLPYIMQQAVSGTQTGIGGVMKLYNIDIKWFGYPGLEAGDCITTEQDWLNTQSLDFFVMENVYKPHSPCTIRSFGEAASNIYTNSLTEPGRFARANITTTKDVIEHVTPWEEDPVEEETTIYGLVLTQAAYDALERKEANYYYAINDDVSSETTITAYTELTQSEYDAMGTHEAATLYIIKEGDDIENVMFGDTEVSRLYFGDTELWSRGDGNLWIGAMVQNAYWNGNSYQENYSQGYCANPTIITVKPNTTYRFSFTAQSGAATELHTIIINGSEWIAAGNTYWGTTNNPITFITPTDANLHFTMRDGFGRIDASKITDILLEEV